jgi:hypothetical protein
MARVYHALPPTLGDRNKLSVISFRTATVGDPELQQAQSESGTVLSGRVFRVDLCRLLRTIEAPADLTRRRMPIANRQLFFASSDTASRAVLRRISTITMWSQVSVDF